MSELDDALHRAARYNNGAYHPETNPYGHAGKGGTLANWVRSLRDAVTVYNATAGLFGSINFVAERAAVQAIYGRCQELVRGITAGSTQALNFPALDKVLASATDVVAVHIYDTRLDDRLPGGARWNEPGRCAGLSWHAETLDTASRGMRRDFPAVAVLVVQPGRLTIYDALDLDATGQPRMWRVFSRGANNLIEATASLTSVAARNGRIVLGTAGVGCIIIDLPADSAIQRNATYAARYRAGLAQSDAGAGYAALAGVAGLPTYLVSAVASWSAPGSPLDDIGLPVPTVIAAYGTGTAAGLAVIHPSGQIAAIGGYADGQTPTVAEVLPDGAVLSHNGYTDALVVCGLPYSATTIAAMKLEEYGNKFLSYGSLTTPSLLGAPVTAVACGRRIAAGGGAGLTLIARDAAMPSRGMVAYVTALYATGWQPAAIRLATLCDATVGLTSGTVEDRSHKGHALDIHGVIQRVAANAGDVAAWTGWGGANWLSMAYAADFDFGTGDFAVVLWIRGAVGTILARRQSASAGAGWTLYSISGSDIRWQLTDGTTPVEVSGALEPTAWHQVVACRRAGVIELWLDGVRLGAAACGYSVSDAAAVLGVGAAAGGGFGLASTSALSLLRIAGSAPTPAQIGAMHADERPLFQPGARCVLGGASSAVQALDYDPVTGRLAVATAGGSAVFQRLVRVAFAAPTTVSANVRSVGMRGAVLAVATTAETAVAVDGIGGKDAIVGGGMAAAAQRWTLSGVTTDATPLTLSPRITVGERESGTAIVAVKARTPGPTATEDLTYHRRVDWYRDAGGNVTIRAVITVSADDETTASPCDCTWAADTAAQTIGVQVIGRAGVTLAWSGEITILARLSEDTRYA